MADEPQEDSWQMEHVEVPQFRTIFAGGAVFTGPIDSSNNWLLTFYNDGAVITSETLERVPGTAGYTNTTPPTIRSKRIRRDEVCIVMSQVQLASLVHVIKQRLDGTSNEPGK